MGTSGSAAGAAEGLRVLGALDMGRFEEMERLEAGCYGPEFIAPAAEAYAWYLRLPDSTVALADGAGAVVGFVNMFPVTDGVYRALRAGTFNDADLKASDVVDVSGLAAGPGPKSEGAPTSGPQPGSEGVPTSGPLHMFLSCIVVERAHRGGEVARALLREAVARYERIEGLVDEIVTDNVTPEGVRFSRRWGFAPVCASDHASQVFAQPYAVFVRRVREG